MSVTKIIYRDVPPGATDGARTTVTGNASFANGDLLIVGGSVPDAMTLELNTWALDGSKVLFGSSTPPYWSQSLSDADSVFATTPTITVKLSDSFSATGVTLMFADAAGAYCSEVLIRWYSGDTLVTSGTFYPDEQNYFCEKSVEGFDTVEITITSTALPYTYAKLEQVIIGTTRVFDMSQIKKATIKNETDLISLDLPGSELDFTLESRTDTSYMFQLKQPIEVWNDGRQIGTYYIRSHKRTADRTYSIECGDAFMTLGDDEFPGGYYSNYSAAQIVRDITNNAYSLIIADDIADKQLTGIITAGQSKREALRQVFFAWGVTAATDGGDAIRLFNYMSSSTKEIGEDSAYTGADIETDAFVTGVRLTAHSYTQSDDGEIEIDGVSYTDTQTVVSSDFPGLPSNAKPNLVEITDATLISPQTAPAIAGKVFAHVMQYKVGNSKIVWGGEKLGDRVQIPTPWGETVNGHISGMEINVSNTIAATCEVVLIG